MDSCGFYSDDCQENQIIEQTSIINNNNNITSIDENLDIIKNLRNNPIVRNKYSLTPDMALGWKPKSMTVKANIPIKQSVAWMDQIKESARIDDTLIYEGFRAENTYQLHSRYSNKELKEEPLIKQVLRNQQNKGKNGKQQLKKVNCYRFNSYPQEKEWQIKQIIGMCGSYVQKNLEQSYLVFDSDFESGNLDFVIRRSPDEYDLFLRVDSNTKGHSQWFFFSLVLKGLLKSMPDLGKRSKVKLNIMNLSKHASLYKQGMKPYMYTQGSQKWLQDPLMECTQQPVSQLYYQRRYGLDLTVNRKYCLLSFTIHPQQDLKIHLAYCEPYTYSMLLDDLQYLQETNQSFSMQFQTLGSSLGGLPIPMVKVWSSQSKSNPTPSQSQTLSHHQASQSLLAVSVENVQEEEKVLLVGRVHPGEPNGSIIIQQILQELSKSEDHVNYLIVPMLNIDGVVNGNFRTSFSGKDLNRMYGRKDPLCPEVSLITDLALSHKLIAVIDLHGHSSKQNVFLYGGGFVSYKDKDESLEYLNKSREYYECRLFVNNLDCQQQKLISPIYQNFNKRGCVFGLSPGKYHSCRGYFYRQGILQSYTVEASNMGYHALSSTHYYGQNKQALHLFAQALLATIQATTIKELQYRKYMAHYLYRLNKPNHNHNHNHNQKQSNTKAKQM